MKAEQDLPDKTKMAAKQEVQKKVKSLDVQASQIVDTRPVSFCQFSPDASMLATASWSGKATSPSQQLLLLLRPNVILTSLYTVVLGTLL